MQPDLNSQVFRHWGKTSGHCAEPVGTAGDVSAGDDAAGDDATGDDATGDDSAGDDSVGAVGSSETGQTVVETAISEVVVMVDSAGQLVTTSLQDVMVTVCVEKSVDVVIWTLEAAGVEDGRIVGGLEIWPRVEFERGAVGCRVARVGGRFSTGEETTGGADEGDEESED